VDRIWFRTQNIYRWTTKVLCGEVMISKFLTGHTNEHTALLIPDYPYGRKVRCRIRYWIESDVKKGFRFCSQTENPKNLYWNAPKKGTYCKIAMVMFLDERDYVQHAALSEYDDVEKVLQFIKQFPILDEDNKRSLLVWCAMKAKLAEKMANGTAYFELNGVKQEKSPEEIERYKKELEQWNACLNRLTGKVV
jgi:hypothetical protein